MTFGLGLPGVGGRFGLYARAGAAGAGSAQGITLIDNTFKWENVAANGSITVDVPVETLDGHTMLMHVGVQDDAQILTNPPVGWTHVAALDAFGNVGDDLRANLYTRVASSEPATYDVTQNHLASLRQMNVSITTWSGVHADIFDVTPVAGHSAFLANEAKPPVQAITSVTDGAEMVLFVHQGFDLVTAHVAPSGYTIHANQLVNALSAAIASKNIATAGLEAPGPWDNASATPESTTISCMLKPAD